MNLVKFLEILTAILFAFWFRKEIPLFAKRINQQTYDEFYSLVDFQLDYSDFEKKSNLKAKQSKLPILFYFYFSFNNIVESKLSYFSHNNYFMLS